MAVKTKRSLKIFKVNPEFAEVSQMCIMDGREAFLRRPDGSLATVFVDQIMFHQKGLIAIVRGTTPETVNIWRAYHVSRLLRNPV